MVLAGDSWRNYNGMIKQQKFYYDVSDLCDDDDEMFQQPT